MVERKVVRVKSAKGRANALQPLCCKAGTQDVDVGTPEALFEYLRQLNESGGEVDMAALAWCIKDSPAAMEAVISGDARMADAKSMLETYSSVLKDAAAYDATGDAADAAQFVARHAAIASRLRGHPVMAKVLALAPLPPTPSLSWPASGSTGAAPPATEAAASSSRFCTVDGEMPVAFRASANQAELYIFGGSNDGAADSAVRVRRSPSRSGESGSSAGNGSSSGGAASASVSSVGSSSSEDKDDTGEGPAAAADAAAAARPTAGASAGFAVASGSHWESANHRLLQAARMQSSIPAGGIDASSGGDGSSSGGGGSSNGSNAVLSLLQAAAERDSAAAAAAAASDDDAEWDDTTPAIGAAAAAAVARFAAAAAAPGPSPAAAGTSGPAAAATADAAVSSGNTIEGSSFVSRTPVTAANEAPGGGSMSSGLSTTRVTNEVVPSGFRWLGLRKVAYTDGSGTEREWEACFRTTRPTSSQSGSTDAVYIVALVEPPERLPTPQLPASGRRFVGAAAGAAGEKATAVGASAAAAAAVAPKEVSIVLVRQFRPPVGVLTVEFPAGLVDDGETCEAAAVRELREETGFVGQLTSSSPITYSEPGMTNASARIIGICVDPTDPDNSAAMAAAMANASAIAAAGWGARRQPGGAAVAVAVAETASLGADEHIEVLLVPLSGLVGMLDRMAAAGVAVDAPLYAFALGRSGSEQRPRLLLQQQEQKHDGGCLAEETQGEEPLVGRGVAASLFAVGLAAAAGAAAAASVQQGAAGAKPAGSIRQTSVSRGSSPSVPTTFVFVAAATVAAAVLVVLATRGKWRRR